MFLVIFGCSTLLNTKDHTALQTLQLLIGKVTRFHTEYEKKRIKMEKRLNKDAS